MKLIDAHIHLDFYDQIDDVINRLVTYNIQAVFVTHLPELFEKYYMQMCNYPNIDLALGFHPILAREYDLDQQLFTRMVERTNFVGEVGLDYSITSSQSLKAKQRKIFEYICRCSKNKIMSIHSRLADEDTLEILLSSGVKKAIFHWYSGNESLVPDIIANGYFFSVNSSMLRSNKGITILKQIPKDKLLIESDGPFTKYGGKIISPTSMKNIYNDFSIFYDVEDLEQVVWNNYSKLMMF